MATVSVIVREVHSFKVTVIGEVKTPGRYELKSQSTVLDVLAMAGGLTEYADRSRIVVLRRDGTGTQQIPFAFDKLYIGNSAVRTSETARARNGSPRSRGSSTTSTWSQATSSWFPDHSGTYCPSNLVSDCGAPSWPPRAARGVDDRRARGLLRERIIMLGMDAAGGADHLGDGNPPGACGSSFGVVDDLPGPDSDTDPRLLGPISPAGDCRRRAPAPDRGCARRSGAAARRFRRCSNRACRAAS